MVVITVNKPFLSRNQRNNGIIMVYHGFANGHNNGIMESMEVMESMDGNGINGRFN